MKILQNNFFIRCAKVFSIILCVSVYASAQKISADETALASFEKSIEQGKFADIEKSLLDFVIAHQKDAKGFALLAKLRLNQNRLSEAKSLYQKALTLDPNLLSSKLNLALVEFQTGETEQTRQILNGVSETEIADVSSRLELARVFSLVGDCKNALDVAEKLPEKIKNADALPLRAVCFLESNDKKSFDSLIAPAKTLAKQNPLIAVKFAEILSRAAMHKEAAELLRSITLAVPSNAGAWLLLAKSEIYLKAYADARIHLARAEKLQPENSELLFVKSLLESELGNKAESLDLLEKSLSENPNDTTVLAGFVVAALRAGQSGKAARAAEKLLNLQPDNPDFLYLYGAASLQNNNLQAAENNLRKFIELRPKDSRGCLALGLTLAGQPDKLLEARSQLQNCLAINQNDFEAKYQLGLSYKSQGETAKAIEYLESAVKDAPEYASALRDLGAVYLQNGAEAKARVVLEKAAALAPNDADTHFQLSRLYNLIGETELAKKHLEMFQKLRNPKKDGM